MRNKIYKVIYARGQSYLGGPPAAQPVSSAAHRPAAWIPDRLARSPCARPVRSPSSTLALFSHPASRSSACALPHLLQLNPLTLSWPNTGLSPCALVSWNTTHPRGWQHLAWRWRQGTGGRGVARHSSAQQIPKSVKHPLSQKFRKLPGY